VADLDVLGRRYRRLLWAYPGWYRRERGQEILTTLLDAARPGQRRPAGGEVLGVVVQGLRCRLRPPRGLGYRVVVELGLVDLGDLGRKLERLLNRTVMCLAPLWQLPQACRRLSARASGS
jgi:hypothetical protein